MILKRSILEGTEPVGAPAHSPFPLEEPSVPIKQLEVCVFLKSPHRPPAEMVGEHILRAQERVAALPDPMRVIVVLKGAQPELLIKEADLVNEASPHSHTEHLEHRDLKRPAFPAPVPLLGKDFQLLK